jgi:hypothetical protein
MWGRRVGMEMVSEAECNVCGALTAEERAALRTDLLVIPIREPICEHCLMAWARNVGFGPLLDGPTTH